MEVTRKKVGGLFYWKGMKKQVRNYVRACKARQRCKPILMSPNGLLQPLPDAIWVDISMDFIEGVLKSRGKDVILVVVDRLSKYAHFLALSHSFFAAAVAQLYLSTSSSYMDCPKP